MPRLPTDGVCGVWQRRRGDSLNYVRDEAVRESLAQMVTPWEAIEELEPRFAGVTDEAQLKILNGFTGLGRSFITKLEKLGLKTIVPGASPKHGCNLVAMGSGVATFFV